MVAYVIFHVENCGIIYYAVMKPRLSLVYGTNVGDKIKLSISVKV